MFINVSGILDSLINLVPGTDMLTIMPFLEVNAIPIPAGTPFVVQFNPESYDLSEQSFYDSSQAFGSTSSTNRFNYIAPKEFSFEFTLDGTGASGIPLDVSDSIAQFKRTVGFNGNIHRPNLLFVVWGTFKAMCVVTRYNIKHSLFSRDGTPLRASITVNFRETTPKVVELLQSNLQSPDLSERRLVKDQEKLPLVCFQVYGNSRHYLEVARANGLTNFRKLKPGIVLDFPPVEK